MAYNDRARPDMDDLPHTFWNCDGCNAQNSCLDGECQYCEIEKDEPALYSVAIYLIDRAYGGPEEGGWYYNRGVIVDCPLDGIDVYDLTRLFPADQLDQARICRDQLQAKLDAGPNVGRRDIGSVLSNGSYAAIIEDGLPRRHWPRVRPHYE